MASNKSSTISVGLSVEVFLYFDANTFLCNQARYSQYLHLVLVEYRVFYKQYFNRQHFYQQHQAEIYTKLSKSEATP